jgi:hypothetical protein
MMHAKCCSRFYSDEALVVAGVEAYTKAVDKKFLVARVGRWCFSAFTLP